MREGKILKTPLVFVTDRGGHLQNARSCLENMRTQPGAWFITKGPEVAAMREQGFPVQTIPYIFSWWGKKRIWNPLKTLWSFLFSFYLVVRFRPRQVVSFGASDVVPFCYVARLFGARLIHVECMNQVSSPSLTGRMLYPIADHLFVQWEDLLPRYGKRAEYAGWVI